MAITLRSALEETTRDWKKALPQPWRSVFKATSLNLAGVPNKWKHDPWVPIFPVFRDPVARKVFQADKISRKPPSNLIGVPPFAHTFRALLVPPSKVRVVIVGQDPYPDNTDATGQSFEQGNLRDWVIDAHNVAGSLKPILKLAAAVHTGDKRFAQPKLSRFQDPGWDRVVNALDSGDLELLRPDRLFPNYQKQGVLWLNTTLTISLFRVPPREMNKPAKPGYQDAHAALWKPFVTRLFDHLAQRSGKPLVFGLWGSWAKSFKVQIMEAAEAAGTSDQTRFVEAGHPVTKPFMSRKKNVFEEINEHLKDMGSKPIEWLPS